MMKAEQLKDFSECIESTLGPSRYGGEPWLDFASAWRLRDALTEYLECHLKNPETDELRGEIPTLEDVINGISNALKNLEQEKAQASTTLRSCGHIHE